MDINPNLLEVPHWTQPGSAIEAVENQDVNKTEYNKDNVKNNVTNTNLTAIKAKEKDSRPIASAIIPSPHYTHSVAGPLKEKEDNNEKMEIKDNNLKIADLVLYLLLIIFFVIKVYSNSNITEDSKAVWAIKDQLTNKPWYKPPSIDLTQVFSNKEAMEFLTKHITKLIRGSFEFNVTNNVKSLILGKIESHIKLPNYT